MATFLSLDTIGSGYNLVKINSNFTKITAAFQDVLSRSGNTPNAMNADFDLNSNDVLNGGIGNFQNLFVNGTDIHSVVGVQGPAGPTGPAGTNGLVTSLVAGTGISINSSTPSAPVITNTGAVSDGDKGDIVVASSGTVWTIDSAVITAAARTVLDDASISAMRTTLGLAIGTDVQAQSTKLQNVANLANASGQLTNDGSGGLSWTAGGGSGALAVTEEYTGNGTVGTYPLVNQPNGSNSSIVQVGGVVQPPSKYTIGTLTITFVELIPSGIPWSITMITGGTVTTAGDRVVIQYSGLGTGPYALGVTPPSYNSLTVIIGGVVQRKSTSIYTLSGTNVTLSATPGTDPVEIWVDMPLAIGTPGAGTVGTSQLATGPAKTLNALANANGVLRNDGSGVFTWRNMGPDVILEENQTSGTAGGAFTSGADQTRILNTKVYDPNSYCTLASNQFSLPAGTWDISWEAPAFGCEQNQSWLYNATDATVVKRGTGRYSQAAASAADVTSTGEMVVTIAGTKAFEIRHRCITTKTINGFGVSIGLGTEVYTRVMITRVS